VRISGGGEGGRKAGNYSFHERFRGEEGGGDYKSIKLKKEESGGGGAAGRARLTLLQKGSDGIVVMVWHLRS